MDDPKPNASILKDDMDEDTCTSVISSQDSTAAKETPFSVTLNCLLLLG
jgi:hypothetical protein